MYLSFGVGNGSGYSGDDLTLWSYDGTIWSKFTADDLTCDGNYASFTTTSMGCFAVTVPEPSAISLLAFGLTGLAAIARRKGRNA